MEILDTAIELLKKLISFPTISSNSNHALIEFVSDFLEMHNVNCFIQPAVSGDKYNLLATLGPRDKPGIILSGHTDVVPVENQPWDSDPFSACIRNNRVYGRGACDMKGFIASILASVPSILASAENLNVPIHILLTYDEEVGCQGAKCIVDFSKNHFHVQPLLCIVGEPSQMQLVNAHKGMCILKTKIKGVAGHSSSPNNTASAVTVAAQLSMFLVNYASSKKKEELLQPCGFKHPYLTINIGKIIGGTAINIVPQDAEIDWEMRYIDRQNATDLLDSFNQYSEYLVKETNKFLKGDELKISTKIISSIPSLAASKNDTLINKVQKLLNSLTLAQVDYCTEGGLYQKAWECPTFICGPGSIEQAHKANEFIEIEQLEASLKFLKKIADISKCGTKSKHLLPSKG